MLRLFSHCCQWTVPGTDQCRWWKGENLFPNFLFCQAGGLKSFAYGPREKGVSHDGYRRRTFRPMGDEVRHSIFRVSGRFPVADTKIADVNELVLFQSMARGGISGMGPYADLRKLGSNGIQSGNVIMVGVSDEQMGQMQFIFFDAFENGFGFHPGVK